ncbi:Txe/YoeB family addiction module toxin [Aliamphritea hakodatensis]|uniref:Txe/YoeB family addiction module toxin n=1 Tax=Aliamphritea hakodatensis TaxID=2895352 RepID=UPI0022FD91D5|nr:Txe/YoeB family addiction module toxin [Aliamphritea hakodatensis]
MKKTSKLAVKFAGNAWEDYLYWQTHDKKQLKRINQLIGDIRRNPFAGLGKPEALKGDLAGFWSRRIDREHRLVYAILNDDLVIVQCRYHYG